ncbi:MAG TPA: hypothetical protein DCY59_06475 [Micrococcaceae bacterium]|nr:hypothetical protein [Micrococcaceae bacterium]
MLPKTPPSIKTCSIPECERPVRARGWCHKHYVRWARGGDPNRTSRIVGNDHERFWGHVNKTDTCWNWTASIGVGRGYGEFRLNGRNVGAHRVSYEWANGPIPAGCDIDHICHNRKCVNPSHLRQATRKQNMENLEMAISVGKSGRRGVFRVERSGKWRAKVTHHGRQISVGTFETIEEADRAAIAKRNELFTHNDRDRIPA